MHRRAQEGSTAKRSCRGILSDQESYAREGYRVNSVGQSSDIFLFVSIH